MIRSTAKTWWLGFVLLAIGCGTSDSDDAATGDASGSPESRGRIGVSVLTFENPFFVTIGDTITEEAELHGFETLVVSGDKDANKQANQVNDFISQGVVAIVLTPCDSMAVGAAIREANEAGIPVFTADIKCQDENCEVVFHVATDNLGGGREAGQAMIEALDGQGGEVAILDFNVVESCQLRVQGFREVLEAHNSENPEAPIEIVSQLPGGGLREEGYSASQDIIQSHPDLAGIFAINDPSALGAYQALVDAGKQDQVVIIGFDGQPDGKEAIRDGKIYADPIQFPDRMAKETVAAIVAHLQGEELEPELLIPTELYRQADALLDPELLEDDGAE